MKYTIYWLCVVIVILLICLTGQAQQPSNIQSIPFSSINLQEATTPHNQIKETLQRNSLTSNSKKESRTFASFSREPLFLGYIGSSIFNVSVSSSRIDGKKFEEGNPLWRRSNGSFAPERNIPFRVGLTFAAFKIYQKSRAGGLFILGLGIATDIIVGTHDLRVKERQ